MVGKKRMIEKERMDSLSAFAKSEIKELNGGIWSIIILISVIIVLVGMFGSCMASIEECPMDGTISLDPDFRLFFYSLLCLIPVGILSYFLGRSNYNKGLQTILNKNEDDQEKAESINEAIAPIIEKGVGGFPEPREANQGEWLPYQVAYGRSENGLRGVDIVSLEGFGLDMHLDRHKISQCINSASVLFLRNKKCSKTIRVFLLTQGDVKSIFREFFEKLCVTRHSHTATALETVESINLGNLSYPSLLDTLVLSCEEDLGNRPGIKVKGEEVQPGIIVASELEVEGQKYTYIPSGFFHALFTALKPVLGLKTRADLRTEESGR